MSEKKGRFSAEQFSVSHDLDPFHDHTNDTVHHNFDVWHHSKYGGHEHVGRMWASHPADNTEDVKVRGTEVVSKYHMEGNEKEIFAHLGNKIAGHIKAGEVVPAPPPSEADKKNGEQIRQRRAAQQSTTPKENFDKSEFNELELLEKKCPRCGATSANPSNPSGRCSSCLKKLKTNKKKPGHYLHEHKLADDAMRRQRGGTEQTKNKPKKGSRKAIIAKVRDGYRKYGKGKTLSPDRKNNSEGYNSSNTRMIPKELNRGRHNADEKKIKNWREKVKKSDIDTATLKSLLMARALERDEEIAKSLQDLTEQEVETLLGLDRE